MGHLTLAYLGTFQATLGNRPIANFRSAKVQALLVYLSLTPQQTHAREALATLFWPDESEAAARRNLRQSLFRLRKVLEDTKSRGEPFLLVTRSTIQFNTAGDSDLDLARAWPVQYRATTDTDVTNFIGALKADLENDTTTRDFLLRSILGFRPGVDAEENRVGNSFQDLLLSLKGVEFGGLIRLGSLESSQDAAMWLRALSQ